jgi:hypothetical protein
MIFHDPAMKRARRAAYGGAIPPQAGFGRAKLARRARNVENSHSLISHGIF